MGLIEKVKFKGITPIVIFLVVFLILFLIGYSLNIFKQSSFIIEEKEILNNSQQVPLKTLRNYLPETNQTCDDLVPNEINLKIMMGGIPSLYGQNLLKNGEDLWGTQCEYNKNVGQKASEFKCIGSFGSGQRLSEEGIILRPYFIEYVLYFDDDYCRQDKGGEITCQILNHECKWEYHEGW
jgi:hypothetical protein